MGKAALEGLKGVRTVSRGFQGFREINTVVYDPALISPEKMVSALKKADTYVGVSQQE